MSETCGTCANAVEIDTHGSWVRHGFPHQDHVHCKLSQYLRGHVMRRNGPCTYSPSKWEPCASKSQD
jgi:hypothetical protein